MPIGIGELLIILLIILVFFGASRVPQLARSLGRSTNEFKTGLNGGKEQETPDDQ
jgi:sec-independent protein translocase protein TatA